MKTILLFFGFILSLSSYANIEFVASKNVEPSTQEVEKSRACFQEAAVLGCRHPEEDLVYFRSCMQDQKQLLSQNCKAKFQRLYGI